MAGAVVGTSNAPARPGELERSCLDAARLRSLGWRPEVGIDEGLDRTLRHIAAEREAA